ncbi:MAG: methyl-accepting chemotaxis sensory transducer [Clostridiaceae bacterium]|jgi:methyl-accepting chemotaxis protein|nr:methyl-accepting chemotaxis sensory transducer [Clostridiaceae bacterium]
MKVNFLKVKKTSGKIVDISEDQNSLQPYQDKLDKLNVHGTEVLIHLNNLLQYMTQLDYVKDIIADVNQQSHMVENIAASSEELSATTEDVSVFVQNSYKRTQDSVETSKETIEKINLSFKKIDTIIDKTYEAKNAMELVNEKTKKIDNMVGIIKNVADQTNLLSLNASIEAARAGEHGAGFSVVASEIKNLAESTKFQAEDIRKTVADLINEISTAAIALNDATASFHSSKAYINDALSSMNDMNNILSKITDSFTEISANVEEQTAAAQEMASNLMVINDKTSIIKDETIKTGKAFYEISKIVDEIRILCFTNLDSVDRSTQIEICISDHLIWRWRVYNMLLGNATLDESAVGTHLTCRLGKWIQTQNINTPNVQTIFDQLNIPHSKIHELAKKAIHQYNNKDTAGAENTLKYIDTASKEVIDLLNKLKSYI